MLFIPKNFQHEDQPKRLDNPEVNSKGVAQLFASWFGKIKVIGMTNLCELHAIEAIYTEGAKGCILKDSSVAEISKCLYAVVHEEEYLSAKIKNSISIATHIFETKHRYPSQIRLTVAETKVLVLLCKQYTTIEIAKELRTSPRTVEHQRHALLEKTKALGLAGLIVYALKNGIIKLEDIPLRQRGDLFPGGQNQ